MKDEPYLLAVAGHKGGTGRTTTAAALAWWWGQHGRRVTLHDADAARTAGFLALSPDQTCPWPNVTYRTGSLQPTDGLTVIDCPPLLAEGSDELLRRADGVLLSCVADPLSLQTVPAAAAAVAKARQTNAKLELLGIVVGQYAAADEMQSAILERLRKLHGQLLLDPPVPDRPELRNWALTPGAPLPEGPARAAFAELARHLPVGRRSDEVNP